MRACARGRTNDTTSGKGQDRNKRGRKEGRKEGKKLVKKKEEVRN